MQHNLRDFLRYGGDGQYVVTKQNGTVYGCRTLWWQVPKNPTI